MASPSKRPRLSLAPDTSQDAYYTYPSSPDSDSASNDENENEDANDHDHEHVDLETARAQNDQRLKSIFEGIFAKYSRDFADVGDEIDLQTGKVVVDNGHLLGMEGEDDTGDAGGVGIGGAQGDEDEDGVSGTGSGTEEGEGYDYDYGIWSFSGLQSGLRDHGHGDDNAWEWQGEADDADGDEKENDYHDDEDRSSVDSLLDTALSVDTSTLPTTKQPAVEPSRPLRNNEHSEPAESIWAVPEVEPPKFSFSTPKPRPSNNKPTINYNPARSVSPPGARSLWALPHPGRPRRTNTDVPKEKKAKKDVTSTKKSTVPSTAKPKISTPVAKKSDWSFAIQNGSESESDDPLQEDYASPTPKYALNIRGKQASAIDTASKTQPTPKPIGSAQKRSLSENIPTPTKTRQPMTPDEVKLIVTMRYVHKKQWKQILAHFPGRPLNHLRDWNKRHWSRRRVDPPRLSRPWSSEERDDLSVLKDRSGLSWSEIQKGFPGRSHAEIEFELLRLWVGEEVWNESKKAQDGELGRDRLDGLLDDGYASQEEGSGSAGVRDRASAASVDQELSSVRSKDAKRGPIDQGLMPKPAQDDVPNADSSEALDNGHDTAHPEPYQGNRERQPQSSPQKTLSTLFE